MAKAKPTFTWDPDLYRVDVLKSTNFVSLEDQIKEYRRMRKIALKRLKTFEGTDLVNTETYRYYSEALRLPASKLEPHDIPYALSDAARFLASDVSTKSKMQASIEKHINTLHNHGYDFVKRENFLAFTDFMEQWKAQKVGRIYDSERVAELFGETRRLGLNQQEVFQNFNEYLKNLENLKEIEVAPKTGDKSNRDYVMERLKHM